MVTTLLVDDRGATTTPASAGATVAGVAVANTWSPIDMILPTSVPAGNVRVVAVGT